MSLSRSQPQLESIIEDTMQCLFFFTSLGDSDEKYWEQRCSDVNEIIENISSNYIWHKDKLKIYLPIEEDRHKGFPPHLASSTCFGDNIEDEWFIVYIVFELTKKYNDLIVQLRDNDGEFLLIEAANILPSWANPENTDNRVFIANNHIHIIKPDVVNLDTTLNLQDAIKIVSNKQTCVSTDIDQAIFSRIGNYPEKIQSNTHKAIVNLPVSIATLLSLNPALIAPIVSAYCNHDVIDAKACQNISFENCVTVEVKFTKFLYAMLTHSKLLKYKSNTHKVISEKDKKNVNGFKLACGFQILMNSPSDIFSTKEYNTFLSSLKDNGYFKDNVKGSKEYAKLLEKAKSYFTNMECPRNVYICNEISQIMSSNEYTNHMKRIKINSLATEEFCEDNEDWMNIQPDQLNSFLNTNYGNKTKFKKDDTITPEVITSELSSFLTKSSDFEGIETYDEDNDSEHIHFDADEFNNCLEKIMNLLSSEFENIDCNSETSEIDEIDELENNYENEMDIELKMKLNDYKTSSCTNNSISQSIIQSIREEQASSGPSSNLLQAVSINKCDVLDADDGNNN